MATLHKLGSGDFSDRIGQVRGIMGHCIRYPKDGNVRIADSLIIDQRDEEYFLNEQYDYLFGYGAEDNP
jgi:hypothetical protein